MTTIVKVTLLNCSAPLWELSTSQRQMWRSKVDGTLLLSGFPIVAVDAVGDAVTLYGPDGRWWTIRRADYERVVTLKEE